MGRTAKRLLSSALGLALASPFAHAYTYWVYFANRTGPFNPAPLRFEVSALPSRTVYYFISEQGPSAFAAGDTFASVVSEIRLAAKVWNDVESSDLRVRFGGFASPATPQGTPGIDIFFDDDMPAGLLAQTLPLTVSDVSAVASGAASVPILRSRIQLRRDLGTQPSYREDFFQTLVHEFGHALGLQHTLTSSVMSTLPTSAATKSRPLAADDIAGISLLYPTGNFRFQTGAIMGRVTLAGAPVNMASVVAMAPGGAAVSALTNPDGTYVLQGLPPGQYLIYAHPLPPAQFGESRPANIEPPHDVFQGSFPATQGFDAQFYPGVRDWAQATPMVVNAGQTIENLNFAMQRRNAPPTQSVQFYGFFGSVAVKSPPLPSGVRSTVAFYGPGLTLGTGQPVAGLSVSIVGGTAQIVPGSLRPHPQALGYLVMEIETPAGVERSSNLSITLNNDTYVLPVAFTTVNRQPPSVTSLAAGLDESGNRVVTVAGANLTADTRILFDGAPGAVVRANPDGSLLVAPPPATGNHKARVAALNNDGQSSLMGLGSTPPPVFTYDSPDGPSIVISPNALPAGVESMIEINGVNTQFSEGQTVVGFGSSDVVVRRMWVVSPTRVLLNVAVASEAQPGLFAVTAASGLQVANLPQGLTELPRRSGQATLRTPVINLATGLAGVPAGGTALLSVVNLSFAQQAGFTLTVADQRASILNAQPGQILFQIPASLRPGPAAVRLATPGGDSIFPILMQVDAPPPVIVSAANAAGVIDAAHPAAAGDIVTLGVSGLADAGAAIAPASIKINAGGVEHGATSVSGPQAIFGLWQVQFVLASNVPFGPQTPVTLTLDTRVSPSFALAVRQ